MPLDLSQIRELPLLDGSEVIVLRGRLADVKGAVPGDLCNCVFARTCHRGDMDAVVLRTVTWLVQPATRQLINYNHARYGLERTSGLKVGEMVRVRYRNDDRLVHQIRLWDDEGLEFVPGEFALMPPDMPAPASATTRPSGRSQRPNRLPRRAPQQARVKAARGARP